MPTFYLGRYPVTQAQWRAVILAAEDSGLEEVPSHFKGGHRPVESISWLDINEKFLPAVNRLTEREFRLPSEAEWEYACRGGQWGGGYRYSGSDKLGQVGWYGQNSGNATREVGELLPNELGICDMCGNVWEWCQDHWHYTYHNAPGDGSAWVNPEQDEPRRKSLFRRVRDLVGGSKSSDRGADRVIRGGSYFYDAGDCRPASRYGFGPGDFATAMSAFGWPCPPSQLVSLPASREQQERRLEAQQAGREGRPTKRSKAE